jgi:hypothetical protein
MFTTRSQLNRRCALLLVFAAALCLPLPGFAADDPAPAPAAATAAPAAPKSTNLTINLIHRMVQRGLLSQQDADELIKQAGDDTTEARLQATAAQAATVPTASSAQAAAAVQATTPSATPVSDDTVRVTYVPEVVKARLREEIKQQVMAQARAENWASPRTLPEWVTRFRFFGDFRFRYEGDFFPSGSATGDYDNVNFNAINTGAPFDLSNTIPLPKFDANQDRNRLRLRARLGADIDLDEGWTAGVRFATGENNSPVTENQSLGSANLAQGGNFSKYALWLDRGFLRYEAGGAPDEDLMVTFGRFDNPFFATNLIWADDLGFDGAVVQAKHQVADGVTPFFTMGGFPVFNTDLNFSSTNPTKFKSEDKWLAAAQLGADWKINRDFSLKLGAAYYDFINVEGKLSSPITTWTTSDAGNTDDSRPAFAQSGNTYMQLRDLVIGYDSKGNASPAYQYFGLATPFRDLALTTRLDISHFDPFHVALVGEFVKNLAFSRSAIDAKAVNNLDPAGNFVGGNTGYMMGLNLGRVALEQRWDWNISLVYKYIESDAVVDGFDDSNFGGSRTGTNLKGYILGGNLALSRRVWLGLRWMSADSIAGPTFKSDLMQLDLNGKF